MKFLYSPIIFNGYEYHHDNFIFKDLKQICFEFYKFNTYITCGKTYFHRKNFYYGNEIYGFFSFKKSIRKIQKIDSLNIFR